MNNQIPLIPADQAPIDVENRNLIANLKDEIARLKKEVDECKLSAQVDAALIKAGAKNPACVRALINLNSLELDASGKIVGLDDAIASIKEDEAYLFHEDPNYGIFGTSPAESFRKQESDPFVRGFMNR